MEKLYLLYNGKKLTYKKHNDGTRSIDIPVRLDKSGEYISTSIESDSIGWRMTTKRSGNDDSASSVWITNKGEIAYCSSEDKETRFLGEKIDPNKETDNPVYQKAQELYKILSETMEQIVAYEKSPWTPEQVLDLRRRQLASIFRLLGYKKISDIDEREEPSGEYAALSRVGKILEDYQDLTFVKGEINMFGQQDYIIDIPEFYKPREDESKAPSSIIEDYSKLIDEVDAAFQEDLSFIKEKDEFFARSRDIYRDYFLDMKRKVPKYEWQRYYATVIKTAKLAMGLNYDIIPEALRANITDLTGLSEMEIGDRISELIDSREFANASDIEDRYAVSETTRLAGKLDDFAANEDAFSRGELAVALKELKDEALKIRTERNNKMEAYAEMDRLIKAKQIVISRSIDLKGEE